MSHTPGPWKAEQVGDTGGENPTDVYEITNGYTRIAEYVSDKDAPLIAAAPELREALRLLVDAVSADGWPKKLEHMGPLNNARSVLSKVTGK